MSMAMAVPTPIDRVAVKLTSTTGNCRVAGSRETKAPIQINSNKISQVFLHLLAKYSLFIEVS